jgi:hypothetical protein
MQHDIVFSEKEKEFFRNLFYTYKNPTSEYIEGPGVAKLLTKAKLDNVNFIT